MKNIVTLFLAILFFQSCTSQPRMDEATVQNLIQQENFTFLAERANPTSQDINNLMTQMPYRSGMPVSTLGYGYTLQFDQGKLAANLPYFGRVYNPTYGNVDGGFKFVSNDYQISKAAGKNGSTTLTIKPRDVSNILAIYMQIYKNGKTYVSVSANDRQPISYDGYMMTNEEFKKR